LAAAALSKRSMNGTSLNNMVRLAANFGIPIPYQIQKNKTQWAKKLRYYLRNTALEQHSIT
jgi:hypothetical protein